MTRSESIRHNAKLIRKQVRGKTKAERREFYDLISSGPLGLFLHAAAAIVKSKQTVTVNVETGFDAEYDHMIARIKEGARRPHHRFRI